MSWRLTNANPLSRWWHDASKASLEGDQWPLGGAAHIAQRVWAAPTCWYLLCTHQPFYLFIKRYEHP